MKHYNSKFYAYTKYILVILLAVIIFWYFQTKEEFLLVILTALVAVGIVAMLLSKRYWGQKDKNGLEYLIVYNFSTKKYYPIDKMKYVKKTKYSLAITFSDQNLTKSGMPLEVSPVRQSKFIAQLKDINPDIKIL